MIQATFSPVFNTTLLTVLQTCLHRLFEAHQSQNQCHVFRIFLKQYHTFRKHFLFQLHDKLPQNLVAYNNHFILLMILWVINLGRTHLGLCFFMVLTGPGGSTAMMAYFPAFLVPLYSLAPQHGSVIPQGFSIVISVQSYFIHCIFQERYPKSRYFERVEVGLGQLRLMPSTGSLLYSISQSSLKAHLKG